MEIAVTIKELIDSLEKNDPLWFENADEPKQYKLDRIQEAFNRDEIDAPRVEASERGIGVVDGRHRIWFAAQRAESDFITVSTNDHKWLNHWIYK